MKIGIDASGIYGWRGPSRNVKNLIKSLSYLDVKNEYYLFAPQIPPSDLVLNKKFNWVYIKNRKGLPWINFLLPITVLKYKLDLFIFPQNNFWIWKILKTIVFFRAANIAPFYDSKLDRIEAFLKELRVSKVADLVVFTSYTHSVISQLFYGFDDKKVKVIYNAVDPEFMQNELFPAQSEMDYKYILYVGGTEKNKNLIMVKEAYNVLIRDEKYHDYKLVIVGGKYGRYGENMKQMQDSFRDLVKMNNVIFKGIVKNTQELKKLYSNASLLIFPSLIETFGLVPLEAMACGCPVISSSAPALPEVLGDAALFFNPFDLQDCVSKIKHILDDSKFREDLVLKGFERVKKFSWDRSALQLISLIETLK
jgi:glycosyltransferase involved in cell wall biosynthesis